MVLPNMGERYHCQFDQIISAFLWNNRKPKIPLSILKGLKQDGGGGLVNLRTREESLKAQWIWQIHENEQIKALFEYYV